ncbi:hatching enzyme 1.2-like [Dendropsophus ebraccatus]|uniref:hatching enzyme 1.2-like n=1 Tax=Dendropsophus ebraccatus TaxID=150705 RepID=UPI00383140D8
MELMKLVLMVSMAVEALPRPVHDLPNYNKKSGLGPTVFEIIEAANKDEGVPVFLKERDIAIITARNVRTCSECMWNKTENGIVEVPYLTDPQYSIAEAALISRALKEFELLTCVHFVKRSSELDYLYIWPGVGCWSYIGKTLGMQIVSLASPRCMVYGVIQHEAMHNLGFYHEHTRKDRDDYIDILWENIEPGFSDSFDIVKSNTLHLSYDYASVMHYHQYAYSIAEDLPTIVPKPDPNVPIGQRSGMSNLDIMKINALYDCNLCREKLMNVTGSFSGNSSFANQHGGNCLWLIQVTGRKILLVLDYVSFSSTDSIKVYDGSIKSSLVLLDKTGAFQAYQIKPLVSSGCSILVEYVSKANAKLGEFDMSYYTVSLG